MNMKKNISILGVVCYIVITGCFQSNSEEILKYKFVEIKEDESNTITNLTWFIPINDSLIEITDAGTKYAYFINKNGEFINRISPPLEFVDSIASNQIAASKFMGEFYRFLFLNEITYPPKLANAGERVPIEQINQWISREYSQSIVLNDSIIGISASYDMFVQDMNPNSTKFSRGNENAEIIVLYNYRNRKVKGIQYLNQKDNIYPRTNSMAYSSNDERIYFVAETSSKKKLQDSIPFIISYNENDELIIYNYLPQKVSKYSDYLGLVAPIIKFTDGNLFCIFRLLDDVYNLNENTSFKIQNLKNDNIDYLNNFDYDNPNFDKINFSISYLGLLKNQNLLLIIDRKLNDDNHELLLQEYTQKGEYIKSKTFSKKKKEFGEVLTLQGLDNKDIIFGLSYDEETETNYLISFEW